MYALLVAALVISMAASLARAWAPPDGPAIDQTTPPTPTPTTLLRGAHGYIIQNGISILYNDGYWFAAQMLRQWQQELLNGVRYADAYLGRQRIVVQLCLIRVLFTDLCAVTQVLFEKDWPLGADNHYFNPDTGRGYNPGKLNEVAFWADLLDVLFPFIGPLLSIDVDPPLHDEYPSAVVIFDGEYANALNAYFDSSAPGIGGRQGTALAMFYLGWASHLLQDLTVVHHTFDEGLKDHSEYENAADGLGETFAPIADGQKRGIYEDKVPVVDCVPGSRTCFLTFAANASHEPVILQAAADKDYSHIHVAIPFAQNLQAGLYAAFLTDIGLRPVHMSAVIAAL
jgi:hypothetical protein